mgnify:CR=1 FL=1
MIFVGGYYEEEFLTDEKNVSEREEAEQKWRDRKDLWQKTII